MSRLKFDVHTTPTSRLILNLANTKVLTAHLPTGVTASEVADAVTEISVEIDKRVPIKMRNQP